MEDNAIDKDKIKSLMVPLIASLAGAAAASIATGVVTKLTATNVKKYDITGDSTIQPTKKETSLAADEASGSKMDSSLSKDGVEVQKGGLSANEVNGKASQAQTAAVKGETAATSTGAGASVVDVKALKVM